MPKTLWWQAVAINLLIFGYVALDVIGFHPWTWIPSVAGGWGCGVLLVCSYACMRMRREEKRWNEELHRLIEFNRMLAEERRERRAQIQ